jgi:hypothetical protein
MKYNGTVNGTWTNRVTQWPTTAGQKFTWIYSYEADEVDGEFDASKFTISKGDPIPGTKDWDVSPGGGKLVVNKGLVTTDTKMSWQFSNADPKDKQTYSFSITGTSFSGGLGSGVIVFSRPVCEDYVPSKPGNLRIVGNS